MLKKNRLLNFVVLGLVAGFVLTEASCSFKTEDVIDRKQASGNMLDSFSLPAASECDKASCIRIQKASLGKIFLLMVSGKTPGSTPQWYDVKPMVVSFDRYGGNVALLAQNYSTIYEEIRTENFLGNFKILAEDETTLTFDWGKGLETFIVQSPYQIDAPKSGDQDLTEGSFISFPITGSYVRNIKFNEKNIELEQISRVRADGIKKTGDKISFETREETYALNVQIRSYNLGPAFKMKEADKSRRVGFFVTKTSRPKMSTETVNLVTKWDIDPARGPILVRVSAGVPAEYVEAVKEGVLYWNHAFGREVLTVKTQVDPQAGPEDRSIMIRWLPWMDAGAAYAMGQSDPLTGEVLRAQVFMPAAFTRVGSADLVKLNQGSPVVGNTAIVCDFTSNLKKLNELAREATDSQRLRIAQDSVRSTVAHEMGHALGLRHNFSGSFSAKVSTADISNSAKTYLANPAHPGLETSTSIMDYVSGIDNILMSVKLKTAALSYDKMALTWAYSADDKALDEKVSGYCSDEDIALANGNGLSIYGCERFDAGNNPLLRKYNDAKSEKDNFVKVLFASIIGRLYPSETPDITENIDKVLADTQKWSKVAVAENLKFAMKAIVNMTIDGVPNSPYISREALKAGQVLLAKFGVDPAFDKVRTENLKEAGGYAKLVDGFLRDDQGKIDLNWYDLQVEELIQSGVLEKGKTLGGREYQLSVPEQQKILAFYKGIAELNRKALIKDIKNLIPVVDQATKTEAGAAAVVSMVLPVGRLNQQDADLLTKLVLEVTLAPAKFITVKVGQGLATDVVVAARIFAAEDVLGLLPLLDNKAVSFNQELNRALVKKQVLTGINSLLAAIEANADFSTRPAEEQKTLVKDLTAKGLLSAEAAAWLNREVMIYLAL